MKFHLRRERKLEERLDFCGIKSVISIYAELYRGTVSDAERCFYDERVNSIISTRPESRRTYFHRLYEKQKTEGIK